MSKPRCFVVMPFKSELRKVYELAIAPAATDCGFVCIRADEIEGSGNLVRRIVELIRESDVLIADLSGRNANVFYELGVAHALGNNVIMLAQDMAVDVPFDIASYQVIDYKIEWGGDAVLRQRLTGALKARSVWMQKPSNPVQDFLPEAERPPMMRVEFARMAAELQASRERVDELEQESVRLGVWAAMGKSIAERFGRPGEPRDPEAITRDFMDEIERTGQVQVDVPQPRNPDNKIVFKKLDKR